MTTALRFDGFYALGPSKWEEWHAGVCMSGTRWHYMRYYANGDWISAYRDHAFDFWDFTQSVTPELVARAKLGEAPLIGDDDPLCFAGTYTISNGILNEAFSPAMVRGHTYTTERMLKGGYLQMVGADDAKDAFRFSPQPQAGTSSPSKLLFLPGALGRTRFWDPVASLLQHPAAKVFVGWPGFGASPADRSIRGIDDLVAMVVAQIKQPTALIAQSMGGVIAMRVALERPDLITHLVLAVTSGGIDVAGLGGENWQQAFHEENPLLPRWFSTCQEDLSARLPQMTVPTLLLWGDADPISPVRVGERLASLLPCAHLHVIPGGDHGLAETHAPTIAALIDAHLAKQGQR